MLGFRGANQAKRGGKGRRQEGDEGQREQATAAAAARVETGGREAVKARVALGLVGPGREGRFAAASSEQRAPARLLPALPICG